VGQSLLEYCYVVTVNKRPASANVALELAGGMLATVVVIEKEKKGRDNQQEACSGPET
jgi:hypothetical protein